MESRARLASQIRFVSYTMRARHKVGGSSGSQRRYRRASGLLHAVDKELFETVAPSEARILTSKIVFKKEAWVPSNGNGGRPPRWGRAG